MHTENESIDPAIELGYEPRDISIPQITKSVIGFFAFAIVSAVLAWVFMYFVEPGFWSHEAKPEAKHVVPAAPNPMVQNNITAKTDIADLRAKEDTQLTTTGWADPENTAVHIPIDRAMDIIATRGIPATPPDVPSTTPVPSTGPQDRTTKPAGVPVGHSPLERVTAPKPNKKP